MKRFQRKPGWPLAMVLAVAGVLLVAQSAFQRTSRPDRAPGPAVGARVPAFRAVDQFGRERDLESLRARNGLVLLFFRSADW